MEKLLKFQLKKKNQMMNTMKNPVVKDQKLFLKNLKRQNMLIETDKLLSTEA